MQSMKNNKIIFSADDFGKCEEMDEAILKGFENNVLTSTCIMANGNNYDSAVNEIIPRFPIDLRQGGLGCHLNIIEGKSLIAGKNSMLCDSFGNYNKGFIYMLVNSYNKKFMHEVEAEFRSQIEKLLSDKAIGLERLDHINSHVHTHAIPRIFELTCKLAYEYGFKNVRTQAEPFYFADNIEKYIKMGLIDSGANVIKNLLLNTFNLKNKSTLDNYDLKTNDRFIGLMFTAHMDESTILGGLKSVKHEEAVTEVLVHPYIYSPDDTKNKDKYNEYLLTQNHDLRRKIESLGFEFVPFSRL